MIVTSIIVATFESPWLVLILLVHLALQLTRAQQGFSEWFSIIVVAFRVSSGNGDKNHRVVASGY